MSAAVTILLVALVSLSLLASALPVFAGPAALPVHARLVSTTPAAGSTVATATEVVLTFSETVNETFVEVRVDGPAGDEADGEPTVAGTAVTQALAADLPAGEHTVTYRIVSVDGHPVSGTLSFTTTDEAATPTPTGTPTPSVPTVAPSASNAAPAPSPATAPTAAAGTPGWVLPAAFLTLVALLATGGALLARTRRPTDDGPGGTAG